MKLTLCLVVMLSACGGSKARPDATGEPEPAIDALLADAAVDAEPDATTPAPVSVTVYDSSNAPAPGMRVIFLDGADSPLMVTTTDINGVASAVVPAGSSVTAESPMPPQNTAIPLSTFLDVQPGDALLVGTPPEPPVYASVSVDAPPLQGATSYEVTTSCGAPGGGSTPTMTVSVTCPHPDVYVRAASNAQTLAGSSARASMSRAVISISRPRRTSRSRPSPSRSTTCRRTIS